MKTTTTGAWTVLTLFEVDLSDALTILLALAAVVLAVVIPWTQNRIARRQLTISIHVDYWSVENYLRVFGPALIVQKNWQALSEPFREAYRTTVLQGWASQLSDKDSYELYLGPMPNPAEGFSMHHFRTEIGTDRLTEHQALTLLLYRWSHFAEYYRNKLVDRRLFRALFNDAFGYKREFLLELCKSMNSRISGTDVRPQWIDSIQYLDAQLSRTRPQENPSD